MKKSVYMCLYIGISYLFFDALEAKGQVASTALSITLHPFLSISVNPVLPMEHDDNTAYTHLAYSAHNLITPIVVSSNAAFEVRVKHGDLVGIPTSDFIQQLVTNSHIIGGDTVQNRGADMSKMENETALETKTHHLYSLPTGILTYSITAL